MATFQEATDFATDGIGVLDRSQTANRFTGLADAQRREYEAQIDADRKAMEASRLNPYAKEQRQATMEEWNKFNRGDIVDTPDDPNADNALKQTAMRYGSRVYSPTNYADYDAALKNLTDDKTIHMVAGTKKFTIVPYMDNIPQGSKVSVGQVREPKATKGSKEQEPQLIDIYTSGNKAMADTDLGKLKASGLIKGDIKERGQEGKDVYSEEAQSAIQVFNDIATANPNLTREQVHKLIRKQVGGVAQEQEATTKPIVNKNTIAVGKPAFGEDKGYMPPTKKPLFAKAGKPVPTHKAVLPDGRVAFKYADGTTEIQPLQEAPIVPQETNIAPQEVIEAKPTIKIPPRKVQKSEEAIPLMSKEEKKQLLSPEKVNSTDRYARAMNLKLKDLQDKWKNTSKDELIPEIIALKEKIRQHVSKKA